MSDAVTPTCLLLVCGGEPTPAEFVHVLSPAARRALAEERRVPVEQLKVKRHDADAVRVVQRIGTRAASAPPFQLVVQRMHPFYMARGDLWMIDGSERGDEYIYLRDTDELLYEFECVMDYVPERPVDPLIAAAAAKLVSAAKLQRKWLDEDWGTVRPDDARGVR